MCFFLSGMKAGDRLRIVLERRAGRRLVLEFPFAKALSRGGCLVRLADHGFVSGRRREAAVMVALITSCCLCLKDALGSSFYECMRVLVNLHANDLDTPNVPGRVRKTIGGAGRL